MSPRFIGASDGDPCRPCRGTGTLGTASIDYARGVRVPADRCHECGGTGRKSIRVDDAAQASDFLPVYGIGGYYTQADLDANLEAQNASMGIEVGA